MEDQTITCVDCGEDFIWAVSEQKFFEKNQYEHPPKRCKRCRQKNRDKKAAAGR